MTRHTKLGLGATAGILVAMATLVVFVGAALAAAGTASLNTGTANADGNAEVTLTMGTGVGNWAFDVGFIPADYSAAPTCTTTLGACTVNPEGSSGIVRFAGFDATGNGVGGEVGKVQFDTTKTAGACSALTLGLAAKAGSAFEDTTGTAFAPATYTGGQVCAAAVAATNTPVPSGASGSATASPTPKALPQTGGPEGDSLQLGWIAAAAGLLVVAAAAWTLRAAREDS